MVLHRFIGLNEGRHCSAQDTLRDDCDPSPDCSYNCCVNAIVAPVYFVVFVLVSQFVLVNVVVAVLMKHLEVRAVSQVAYSFQY